MGTITQLAPTILPIQAALSGSFTTQLNVSGNEGPAIFGTTAPSIAVLVEPDGTVETTGPLFAGVYSVSGEVADEFGNSGTWTFTLSVVGVISPQTSVIPVTPASPSGTVIQVPFQIDPSTGAVAQLSNYFDIIAQNIETIVLTNLNERVMNPSFGAGVEGEIFAPNNVSAFLTSDISTQIEQQEPAVSVQSVTVGPLNSYDNALAVTVEYTVNPYTNVNTVTVTTGGTVSQVIA